MQVKNKLLLCLVGNISLFLFLITIVFSFKTHSNYLRFGVPSPNEKPLVVFSIIINTYTKYYILLLIIGIINISKVIIDSIGIPILDWNIYNPDKTKIIDFTKNELLVYSNLFYIFSGLRSIFTIIITITQFDIALYSVLLSQIGTFVTIKCLVDEKEFDNYETEENKKYLFHI